MWRYIFNNPVRAFICKVPWQIQKATKDQVYMVNLKLTAKQITRTEIFFPLICSSALGKFSELLFHLLSSSLIASLMLSATQPP